MYYVGQDSIPPELAQAVSDAAPGEAGEVLREIAEAAAILAASSAVPVVGTVGGAVIVAVKILGPRVFKAITGLFKGRENPWPNRIDRIVSSNVPADEKYLALWALQVLAAREVTGGDESTRRWARGGVDRADIAIRQLWSQFSPAIQAQALARVNAPGREQFQAMPVEQLATVIRNLEHTTGAGWGAFKQAHPEAQLPALQAQLQTARDIYRARQVPPMPPAPPPAPAGPPPMPPAHVAVAQAAFAMWEQWAAANPQQAGCLTPAEKNHVLMLFFRAHATRELSVPDAQRQIHDTIRAACARSGVASAGGTADGRVGCAGYAGCALAGQSARDTYRRGLGALAGAWEGATWAARELGTHIPYRGAAFSVRAAYRQGLEAIA